MSDFDRSKVTELLAELRLDPSTGGSKLREVSLIESATDLAHDVGDIAYYSGPVPQPYAINTLRVIRTLVHYLEQING